MLWLQIHLDPGQQPRDCPSQSHGMPTLNPLILPTTIPPAKGLTPSSHSSACCCPLPLSQELCGAQSPVRIEGTRAEDNANGAGSGEEGKVSTMDQTTCTAFLPHANPER